MPEISQDAFEVAHPGAPTVTSQELRARANSSSGLRPIVVERAAVAAVAPQLLSGSEYLYGYKRESSHR